MSELHKNHTLLKQFISSIDDKTIRRHFQKIKDLEKDKSVLQDYISEIEKLLIKLKDENVFTQNFEIRRFLDSKNIFKRELGLPFINGLLNSISAKTLISELKQSLEVDIEDSINIEVGNIQRKLEESLGNLN